MFVSASKFSCNRLVSDKNGFALFASVALGPLNLYLPSLLSLFPGNSEGAFAIELILPTYLPQTVEALRCPFNAEHQL